MEGPTIKVGSLVRHIRTGQEMTVTAIEPLATFLVACCEWVDGGLTRSWWFRLDSLEPAQ